ncbi:MAG: DUF1634 domain-containing protein [Candidatus Binataceae bacterium]
MPALNEDRLLRVWTPFLLRTILIASVAILIGGMVAMATTTPDYYVNRFHAVQRGNLHGAEPFTVMLRGALAGEPYGVATLGLFALTLVPLARVAFCFLLFVAARDWMYVLFTAYVLIGLVVGVALGRVG